MLSGISQVFKKGGRPDVDPQEALKAGIMGAASMEMARSWKGGSVPERALESSMTDGERSYRKAYDSLIANTQASDLFRQSLSKEARESELPRDHRDEGP